VDIFTALSDPTRRAILTRLRRVPRSVNDLAEELELSQPTTSKHLKVLREAGFLSCRVAAQQRIYQLERSRFDELGAWLESFRRSWKRHLDALEDYLDEEKETHEPKRISPERSRTQQRHGTKRR
jgi:DNA-binding transcriptional ArsR family regulator